MIEGVLQRRWDTSNPPVANVDLLLVLDRPRLDPVIMNRFLVEGESTGIPLAVVLNKADLVTQEMKDSWEKQLSGYKPYICSVETDDIQALDEVDDEVIRLLLIAIVTIAGSAGLSFYYSARHVKPRINAGPGTESLGLLECQARCSLDVGLVLWPGGVAPDVGNTLSRDSPAQEVSRRNAKLEAAAIGIHELGP
ncbi:hypothetical protein SELMODRAFT_419916 [Selaginella moellendorffii]|uniref:EngC GTPase domain-containing protein n=1 Tax=Selaginella moellendorffii TaxID=88036 RepID=D8SAY2_SELML|nr:hypothetical protein SELMODRAFT_419916 [Selaginella moellendorffii]